MSYKQLFLSPLPYTLYPILIKLAAGLAGGATWTHVLFGLYSILLFKFGVHIKESNNFTCKSRFLASVEKLEDPIFVIVIHDTLHIIYCIIIYWASASPGNNFQSPVCLSWWLWPAVLTRSLNSVACVSQRHSSREFVDLGMMKLRKCTSLFWEMEMQWWIGVRSWATSTVPSLMSQCPFYCSVRPLLVYTVFQNGKYISKTIDL